MRTVGTKRDKVLRGIFGCARRAGKMKDQDSTPVAKLAARRVTTRARIRSRIACAVLLAGAPMVAPSDVMSVARADEFSTVPAGDPLYRQMAVVARAAWAGVAASQGSNATLTRYEMALETAKAVIAATARQESGGDWNAPVSKSALRALRELTTALRPELKTLGVDVAATLRLLNSLLKTAPNRNPTPASTTRAPARNPDVGDVSRSDVARVDAFRGDWRAAPLSLLQRLRLTAALSDLERDAFDPFGNSTVGRRRPRFARAPLAPLSSDAASVSSRDDASFFDARASLDVGSRLRLRANIARREVGLQAGLQNVWTPGARTGSTRGGGLDIGLGPNLKLAGDVESGSSDAPDSPSWTRFSGGLGFDAWQNRVSLKVNLSRLVPDDVQLLPSTIAGLNVDLNMTERLSLTMLYQQMFGTPAPDRADRLVGGGISIKF